jgi:O-antigen/teichoic acid export membrane protein
MIAQGLYRGFEQKIFEKHGLPEYPQLMDELYRYFLFCLLGAGFLLSIFSREVFLLFTSPSFLPAYRLVSLLVVPVILNGLITFLTVLVIADQRQTVVTRGTLLSLAVTLPATLGLIRLWGVYGAILSSALSFGIVVAYYLHRLQLKRSYVLSWIPLLALLPVINLVMELLHLSLLPMILLKLGLAAVYLGGCALRFRIKGPF